MSKILAGFTFLSLLLILLGINRGFDISDEGLYMLLANPAQENIAGIFNYDLFFKLFYNVTGIEFGIVGIRGLRLFFYFLAAISLTYFWRNLTGEGKLSINHFFIFLLGVFAGYGMQPPSLSYNSLSVVLACFWITLISQANRSFFRDLLLGLVLALLFYVKITSCLGLGLVTAIFIYYKKQLDWKSISGILLPLIFLETIFLLFLDDNGLVRLLEAIDMMGNREDYRFSLLLKYSLVGVFWLVIVSLPFFAAGYSRKLHYYLSNGLLCIGTLALVVVSYFTTITDEWNHILLLLAAGVLAFQFGFVQGKNILEKQWVLIVLLLIIPFLLHFGSNLYWLRLGIHYLVFWLMAIVFLSNSLQPLRRKLLHGCIAILTLTVVLNGIWINPFEQESLWHSTETWEYKPGKTILLSKDQVHFLSEAKQFVTDKASLLVFYKIPGLAFLLNKNIPKSPGYWRKDHLESFFPQEIPGDVIFYCPYDSLPPNLNFNTQKILEMPNEEQLQVLWRD
ncbi:hypothetical protein SYJ56_19660 [Algoriphagus sp. D3-2-R+10]|uniref:hypothetical protein n=1 Tax=Algoriphagus aurantiacus TaxID=3103948 RepID=UPI002B3BCF33|nr:hypothetical protein [Algoriphagus sp. D3-2-R+10]MEB2777542.1 hypothetical protein [Algoriphagus sp. D3-2-R+10]